MWEPNGKGILFEMIGKYTNAHINSKGEQKQKKKHRQHVWHYQTDQIIYNHSNAHLLNNVYIDKKNTISECVYCI